MTESHVPAGWSRRGLLGLLGALAVGTPLGVLWWRREASAPDRPPLLVGLEALLDTLLPDGERAGHRATGVLAVLWSAAERSPPARRYLEQGLARLDAAAVARGATTFAALAPDAREAVVAAFAAAAPGSPERGFYDAVRDEAFQQHYTHPAAWGPLGLTAPPQPLGYLDHDRPPAA
jgi:hypothetical protein